MARIYVRVGTSSAEGVAWGSFLALLIFAAALTAFVFPFWAVIVFTKIHRAGEVLPGFLVMAIALIAVVRVALAGRRRLTGLVYFLAILLLVGTVLWDFHTDNRYNCERRGAQLVKTFEAICNPYIPTHLG